MPSDSTPIPTSGYTAWFLAADGEPFSLPVVCLIPHAVAYHDGDELIESIEYEPAVLSPGGLLTTLHDAEAVPQFVGGVLAGVAPSGMDQGSALAFLDASKVAPTGEEHVNRLGVVDDEDMVGRVTAARHRLPRRLASV